MTRQLLTSGKTNVNTKENVSMVHYLPWLEQYLHSQNNVTLNTNLTPNTLGGSSWGRGWSGICKRAKSTTAMVGN